VEGVLHSLGDFGVDEGVFFDVFVVPGEGNTECTFG